jgi:hypothetical protein
VHAARGNIRRAGLLYLLAVATTVVALVVGPGVGVYVVQALV